MSRWTTVVAFVVVVMCAASAPAHADLFVGAPEPVPGTLELAGVACGSATACVAVGASTSFTGGVVVPITDGVPGPAQVVSDLASLESVACMSASSCVAVGENEFQTGAVVVSITDGVPGAETMTDAHYLSGVACSSATTCVAVGANEFRPAGVVVSITDGLPGPVRTLSDLQSLQSVACPSATTCLAVGETQSHTAAVVLPITDGVPGKPQTVAGTEDLAGVACSTATSCMAAGQACVSSTPYCGTTGLATTEGQVATIADGNPGVPQSVSETDSLEGAACYGDNTCFAVGQNTAGTAPALVPVVDGIAGSPQRVPTPGNLVSAACPSAGNCLAVGQDYTSGDGVVVPIATSAPPGTDTLTVIKAGSGSGTITAGDGSIECGSSCSASYLAGTTVTLTASAAAGSSFAGWSGGVCAGTAPCSLTLDAGQSVTATFVSSAPAGPQIPLNMTAPAISGTPLPDETLSCSAGTWTGSPTSYTYAWQRHGVRIAGATAATYKVQIADAAQSLACTVTALNGAGASTPARSGEALVAHRGTLTCPKPSGRIGGKHLGPLALGATRTRARRTLRRFTFTGGNADDFCLYAGFGIRAGYSSPSLPHSVVGGKRRRIVLLLTTNPYYSLDGIGPGRPLVSAGRRLKLGRTLRVGLDRWYIAPRPGASAVLRVRHGIIQEIGLADRRLTRGRKAQARLIAFAKAL